MRPGVGGFQNGVSADLMDPAAGAAFVEMSYRAHLEHVRRVPGAVLKGFFTDEPTCSMALYHGWKRWADQVPRAALPWTPRFLEAFRAQHGYDARPRLPLLYHPSRREAVRFRAHFFQTCSRLMRDAFFAPIERFCRENGVLATGHLNGEESFHHHLAAQGGDLMIHYPCMHVPGIDWIVPISNPLPAVAPKFAASVAHRMGLERTMCESFAASGWGLSFQEMRWIVNWEHVNGINLQVPISYKFSLRGPSRATFYNPGISYQQPYWDHFRAFADYEARLCVLASGGGHVAQVALYYPADDIAYYYDDKPLLEARSKAFAELGDAIRHGGYDFDIVDDEAVVELSGIEDGRLLLGTETHDAVVVPQLDTIRRASLEELRCLAMTGGCVVFVGRLPRHSVEDGADDPEVARLLEELLGAEVVRQASRLSRDCPDGQDDRRALSSWRLAGRGRAGFALTSDAAVELLDEVHLPDLDAVPPAENIVAYHRRIQDGDLYLLMNHADRAQTVELTLRAKGTPEVWDPRTGEAAPVEEWRATPNGTWMRLHFHPQELIPIFLRGGAPRTRAAGLQPRRASGERLLREIPIPGPFRFRIEETMRRPEVAWNFTQDADGWTRTLPPPAPPETIPLGDWCEQGLAAFSGIGHYSCDVDLGELPPGARAVLDLGRVAASAEVFVNDSSAGIVLFEPYRLDITRLARPGRNVLRVAVANTLSNYYSQFAELAGKPLDFGGDLPQRRVSGLLGPVAISILVDRRNPKRVLVH
jgi:hypothetical protein